MTQLSETKLYNSVRQILESARNKAYKAINWTMVEAYWEIGRTIIEDEQLGAERATYGKEVLKELSSRLTKDFGKRFSIRNLRNMRNFYLAFPIRQTLSAELSWSHYCQLIRLDNADKRCWYMKEASKSGWSVRQMERQINVFYYERIVASQNQESVQSEAETKLTELEPEQFIKDPYVLEFLDLPDLSQYHESELEQAIIGKLQHFLLELGKGFSFVARQKRIKAEEDNFYIDLVFYHYILKCFVLIDLKTSKLTHQDIGQMDMYIRMFEDKCKSEDDNPTIGIILCTDKNDAVV